MLRPQRKGIIKDVLGEIMRLKNDKTFIETLVQNHPHMSDYDKTDFKFKLNKINNTLAIKEHELGRLKG